ncbi:MAG: flagellar biosynthesis protein FlhB [Lachnospiraceae bacterium]|nr:flagellar biosynthesis protein FlhB [Lachnospiraceae bacterium]
MIAYDLQFFAKEGPGGEKTEEATSKKLDDARKEGQVAKSKEVQNAVTLIGMFLTLKFAVGFLGTSFLATFQGVYNRIPEMQGLTGDHIKLNTMHLLLRSMMLRALLLMAPFLATGLILSFLSDFVQIPWKVTSKPLAPKLSKLNPLNGFKRIFSMRSVVELLKSILKIGLILYLAYRTLKDQAEFIYLLFQMSLWEGIAAAGDLAISLGLRISFVYILVAALDFAYQRYKFKDDMKMTKQEVKDEYKDSEGDPQVKGQQKQRMREASRRRMMQDVPKADVVITNPTHYAVAIRYDTDIAPSPTVLAKGADYVAARIKEVAKENKVEIVENKPLARMLYANVEIGEEVPQELYESVAQVLAYVYHIQGKI